MSIRNWLNGHQGVFTDDAEWQGGHAPSRRDTAVIGSRGDGAPQSDSGGFVYDPRHRDSEVMMFTGPFIDAEYPPVMYLQQNGTIFEYSPAMPTASQVAPGLTLAGLTLDLFGRGSVADAVLQNTTLTSTATVNVVGTAVLSAYYDTLLAGTINVGEPTTLRGVPVQPPAANSHGASSELDITVSGDGSWGSDGNLDAYVPTATNSGVVNIGSGSELRIDMDGGAGGAIKIPGYDIVVAPTRAAFINDGTIVVNAGGLLEEIGYEGTVGNTDTSGTYTPFINNGLITIDGAAGQSTAALFLLGEVSGPGTLAIDGGTQPDPAQTGAGLTGLADTNFSVHDGTLVLQVDGGLASHRFGPQFFGGGITMDGGAVLDLTQGRYFPTQSLDGVFATPVTGFAAGDTIDLQVSKGYDTARATFQDTWNPAQQLLTIQEIDTDMFGNHTTLTAASLTLQGSYAASDFQLASHAVAGNGNALLQVELTTTHG